MKPPKTWGNLNVYDRVREASWKRLHAMGFQLYVQERQSYGDSAHGQHEWLSEIQGETGMNRWGTEES